VRRFSNDRAVIEYLRQNGYQIVATSLKGAELQSLVELKPQPVALVLGNETHGISPEFERQADLLIKIPMYPAIESLNVGVAAGISIYELKLKQAMAMIEDRIKSTLGRQLNVAAMLVQQALDAELRRVSELSSQQVVLMMVLKCDQQMSLTDMCKQFGVLEREVETFLGSLLQKGLIERKGDLRLTPKGEEVLAKLWLTVESTEEKILVGLAPEEACKLLGQLRQIQARCAQIVQMKE
jgi:RNA methyltransferase, TrmH family